MLRSYTKTLKAETLKAEMLNEAKWTSDMDERSRAHGTARVTVNVTGVERRQSGNFFGRSVIGRYRSDGGAGRFYERHLNSIVELLRLCTNRAGS